MLAPNTFTTALEEAESKAADSLARYRFQIVGLMGRDLGTPEPQQRAEAAQPVLGAGECGFSGTALRRLGILGEPWWKHSKVTVYVRKREKRCKEQTEARPGQALERPSRQ